MDKNNLNQIQVREKIVFVQPPLILKMEKQFALNAMKKYTVDLLVDSNKKLKFNISVIGLIDS